ncbi:thiamine pyrophosphate-binding protein [Leucobacter ruminantium]|uniref:Thiamine pyrophosphate-binding protein n=1 Tax=Leucobacter ruminantium TaxID=1289170 RepID=A0A939LZC1_9MICO|nr:thiamine pyrophosphate-binding protein [Leucobacter ruminantium]MBO1804225.1 thiamine pyrophosphate-binding protein [Leucobacter ruminantium]
MTRSATAFTRTLAHSLARHAGRAFGGSSGALQAALAEAGVHRTAIPDAAGAVAAADACARVAGAPAIALLGFGSGFTDATTAIAEAAQARTPLLIVAEDEPGTAPAREVDQEMLAAALGVRSYPLSAVDVGRAVGRAASYALRAARPVVLAVPADLLRGDDGAAPHEHASEGEGSAPAAALAAGGIDLDDPATIASLSAATLGADSPRPREAPGARSLAAPLGLDAAVNALLGAARPLVVAGRGAHLAGAAPELGALAQALGALTATTALVPGIFPDPRTDLGVFGCFGQAAAMSVTAQADVAVVVGASLEGDSSRGLFGAETTVIRIDEGVVGAPEGVDHARQILLQGDAKAVLDALLGSLAAAGALPSGWRESVFGLEAGGALRVRDTGAVEHPGGVCADLRLDPRAVASRIGELLPLDRYVVAENGSGLAWASMFWPASAPERLIAVGAGFESTGLGLSALAGVAAAAPSTSVVLSTGADGLASLSRLESAVRSIPSCAIVVWNEGRAADDPAMAPSIAVDTDFAAVATALGARGVRVERLEALDALGSWVAAGAYGTILLDCRVSPIVGWNPPPAG